MNFKNLKPGDILITKFDLAIHSDSNHEILYERGKEYKFLYLSHGTEEGYTSSEDFDYVEVYCFTYNSIDKIHQAYFNRMDAEGLCQNTTVVQ